MDIRKLILFFAALVCTQYVYSQENKLDELNLILKTDLTMSLKGQWYDVKSFEVTKLSGAFFRASIKLIDLDAEMGEKEYSIDNASRFYIQDGDWVEKDGEYQQCGNIKQIHFFNLKGYSNGFSFYLYNKNGGIDRNESLSGFSILFSEEDAAKKFILLAHKLQGNKMYDNTPWLRTIRETAMFQNQTSRDVFESVSKDFKLYDIKSEQVHKDEEWLRTANIIFKFKYPNIIITYRDEHNPIFYVEDPKFKIGTFVITIPINDARFEEKHEKYNSDQLYINFYSPEGIEVSYNGKKDIVEEYNFYASNQVCKKILPKLRAFKKKVIEENFKGQYGYNSQKKKNTSSQNQQTNKIAGGKYVQ